MLDSINQRQLEEKQQQEKRKQQQHQIYRKLKNYLKTLKIMAGFRKRGCRTRTWFLLKDSVIFVIIMCVLMQITLHGQFSNANAEIVRLETIRDLSFKDNNKPHNTATVEQKEQQNDFQETVLLKESNERKVLENLTKDEFSVIDVNNIKIEEKIIFKTNFKKNFNKLNITKKPNDLQGHKEEMTGIIKEQNSRGINKTQKDNKEEKKMTNKIFNPVKLQHKNANELLKVNSSSSSASSSSTTSLPLLTTKKSLRPSSIAVSNHLGIRENVMLPSEDPEKEAQILYEKTLKEYHVNNLESPPTSSSDSSSDSSVITDDFDLESSIPQRTLHAVCDKWSQKHCHCTGTLGRLSLNCRNIGILAVPVDLPSDTVIL